MTSSVTRRVRRAASEERPSVALERSIQSCELNPAASPANTQNENAAHAAPAFYGKCRAETPGQRRGIERCPPIIVRVGANPARTSKCECFRGESGRDIASPDRDTARLRVMDIGPRSSVRDYEDIFPNVREMRHTRGRRPPDAGTEKMRVPQGLSGS